MRRHEIRAQGRAAERADTLAMVDEMIAGVPALASAHRGAGREDDVNFELYRSRLVALRGTIEAGCHEGKAG